ncbi:MAG TPA: TIGR04351 family putative TOMM peptide [Streptosporangiaceae bacterium]|jgi:putative thiazole/oxazole-modified microcin (TOMM)-like peptide
MTAQSVELTGQMRRDFARLTARAWADHGLSARYENDPQAVLAEFGISLPAGTQPPNLPPAEDDAIDLESLELSAGGALSTIGTVSCPSSPLR